MRIAIVRHATAHAGGAETYADLITSALAARGHDVGVWYETGAAAGGPGPGPRWYGAHDVATAVRELAAWPPDVLFVHGVRSIELEARLLSIAPAVLFAHGYAGMCISGSRLHSYPQFTPCTRRFGAACLALYYPRRCGGWSPRTAITDYRLQSERRRLIERYSQVIVASEHMASEFARQRLGVRVRRVGLPFESAPAVARVPSVRRELLFCGRFEYTKGPSIALHAAARATATAGARVCLTFAGAGSLEEGLRRDAAELTHTVPGFEVEFARWVQPASRDELLRRTDWLLVPSCWPEPFGLVGLEAAAWGVPAVGFDVGGIGEWLRDGINGRLVPFSSPPDLPFADALRDCLALDAAGLDRMRNGAREVAARFGLQAHVNAVEAVLADARGERR